MKKKKKKKLEGLFGSQDYLDQAKVLLQIVSKNI